MNIPAFKVFGDGDMNIEEKIRGNINLLSWDKISEKNKKNIILYLEKNGWISVNTEELLTIGNFFNENYMQLHPFRSLNNILPEKDSYSIGGLGNAYRMKEAAYNDFKDILINGTNEIVYKVISKLASQYIDGYKYDTLTEKSSKEDIDFVFTRFDRFVNCFNHISEQYGMEFILTREGLIPKQDKKIIEDIYIPTISILQNPKYKEVDEELRKVFKNFQDKKYEGVISGSHNVIQKFLQYFLGKKEANGKGAFGKYFTEFKKDKKLNNQFTNGILSTTQSFLSSERATKSEAKPGSEKVSMQDALLVMNTALVFINFCLTKK